MSYEVSSDLWTLGQATGIGRGGSPPLSMILEGPMTPQSYQGQLAPSHIGQGHTEQMGGGTGWRGRGKPAVNDDLRFETITLNQFTKKGCHQGVLT